MMRPTFLVIGLALVAPALADEPCKSGPQPSQRPGPYSSLVAVGRERGQQHCSICEAADRPTIIVFARSLSDPLGKLVHRIDGPLSENKAAELPSGVTLLATDQTPPAPSVRAWSK